MLVRRISNSVNKQIRLSVNCINHVNTTLYTSNIQSIRYYNNYVEPDDVVYNNSSDETGPSNKFNASTIFKDRRTVEQSVIKFLNDFERTSDLIKNADETTIHNILTNDNFIDIGLDSLDQIELMVEFEQKFGVTLDDDESDQIKGVKDVIQYVQNHPGLVIE